MNSTTLRHVVPPTLDDDGSSGIYTIRNLATGRIYVGSTERSFYRRWNQHLSLLRGIRHHNHELQADWLIYGEEGFRFTIVEYCPAWQANSKEATLAYRLKAEGNTPYNFRTWWQEPKIKGYKSGSSVILALIHSRVDAYRSATNASTQ